MEEELLLLLLMSDDEDKSEAVLKKQRRVQLKSLRDASDPFTLPEREFIKNFRMTRSLCLKFLGDLLPYDDQKTSLPFQTRVLAVLYFFGHGSYQKCIGNRSNVPMSQPSISRSLHSILKLIFHRQTQIILLTSLLVLPFYVCFLYFDTSNSPKSFFLLWWVFVAISLSGFL